MFFKRITFLILLFVSIHLSGQNKQANQILSWDIGESMQPMVSLDDNQYAVSAYSMQEWNQRLGYKPKTPKEQQKLGKIVTFTGLSFMAIGGIMTAVADEHYYECVNGNCTGDPVGGFGVAILGTGISAALVGGIIWANGKKKEREAADL